MEKIKFTQKQLKIFRKLGIILIYLFGSHAEGFAHEGSDIDIGIVFQNPEKYRDNTLDAYHELYDIFSDIFEGQGEPDIVFLQLTPYSLQFHAIKPEKILYQKNPKTRFSYEEEVMKRSADLQYFDNLHMNAVLSRI